LSQLTTLIEFLCALGVSVVKNSGLIFPEQKMRFWIRELAGWLLIGLGLYIFFVCYVILINQKGPHLIEAGPLTFIGFIVFRGGIHLLKVAMAARICLHAQREILNSQPTRKTNSKDGLLPKDEVLEW